MNSFGLGLVLNFVDNASSGMNSANQTFLQMSATADSMTASVNASATELTAIAYSLNAVGDTFVNIGSSITGVFTGITQQVIDTGMTIQGYRMQLSALYGSVEAGESKIEEIKQYAMSSVFDIQSLIPAVTTMKAVGIEAMQEVTTSSGQHTQKLLDYASDIAAMVPNMRNTYGTGVAAAMGALKEYIAEGNALTLKRGAGLDITGILGEDKGATIEERTQQVADLVEQLNIVGYTASLAGTPTQRLSNMQDALFNSLSKIADSGVFEVYCGLLEDLSTWVFSLVENEETFNAITGVLADTITSLLSPLQSMLDWVIKNGDEIIEWIENHPKLTKNILLTVAAVGAFLVVGGSLLKMLSSVASAVNGLNMIKSLPKMISFASRAFSGLISRISPFIALAGIAYFVWQSNLFNIRESVTQTMNDLGTVFSLVSEAWNDNTLSVESYQKANELGILPLISSLLQLKYYWGYFTEGFNEGFESFFDGIAKSLSWLKLLGIDINGIAQSIGNFLQSLLGVGAEDKWKAIGEVAGKFAAIAVSILAVSKALTLVKTISSGISSVSNIPLLGGLFGGKGSPTDTVQSKGFLSNPKTVLKTMASLAIIVGGIALLITAVGALQSVPYFNEFLTKGVSTLTQLFNSIIPITASAGALILLVAVLDKLKVGPKSAALGLASLAIVLGGFTVLITAIGALSSIPGFSNFISSGANTLQSLFSTMSVFTTAEFWAMIGAIALLGMLNISTVAIGVAGLATVIAGYALIISAFGGLSKIPGFNEFIQSGGTTLALLFEQVGLAVGSLVGGVAEGVTNSLPKIGEDISAFATNLQPFFNMVKDAPLEEVGSFLVSFAGALLMLGGEELLSFVTGGVNLPSLGAELSAFGESASGFFTSVGNYSEDSIVKSEKVFKALGSMGNYAFKTGGVAQFFTGEVSLDVIGQQLASFAPNGTTFFNTVADYSESGIEKSPKVFEALSGIGDFDFKAGGLAQLFTGHTALDMIGKQLASFAPNGTVFFNAVAEYSDDGMAKTPKAFEALSAIGDYDFKAGGVAQLFTGHTALSVIGSQLASFAPNGTIFFSAVAEYSEDGIKKSKLVFESLSSIGAYEFKSGGLAQLFTGGTNLKKIGEQLSDFGKESKDFFKTAEKYSDVGLSNGIKAINILTVISESNLNSGGLVSLFTGGTDLTNIGKQLSSFGPEASKYFTSVEGLSNTSIENGKKVINTLKELGNSTFQSGGLLQAFTGSVDISNLAKNLSSFGTGSKTFFTEVSLLPENSFGNATKLFESLSSMDSVSSIATTLSGTTLSHLGEELVLFVGSAKQFFEESGALNVESVNNITGALGPFFDTVTSFETSKLSDIATGLDNVSTSTSSFSTVLETTVTEITTNSEGIVSTLTTCTEESLTVLNDFSNKGTGIGRNLMVSIANSITANAYLIRNAVQNAVNSISISIPNIANNAANQARSQSSGSMVGLSTGGYVKTTGIAVLHPNEVVVNDDTTKRLQSFLGAFEDTQSSTSTAVVSNSSTFNNNTTLLNTPTVISQGYSETPQKTEEVHNDYSVTFAEGSVVIQLSNATDAELEKAADKIMKIIARKQQLRAMAVRQ